MKTSWVARGHSIKDPGRWKSDTGKTVMQLKSIISLPLTWLRRNTGR
jgi:hypothetical protein